MQLVTPRGVVESTVMKDTDGELVELKGIEQMQTLAVNQTRQCTQAVGLYPKRHKTDRATLGEIKHAAPKPPVIQFSLGNTGDIALTVKKGGRVIVNAQQCGMVDIKTEGDGFARLQNCTAQSISLAEGSSLAAEAMKVDSVSVIHGTLKIQAAQACENIRLHGDIDSDVPVGAALTYRGPTDIRAKHNLVLPARYERYRCNCRAPCGVSRECRNFCQMKVGRFHMCSPCFIELKELITEVKV